MAPSLNERARRSSALFGAAFRLAAAALTGCQGGRCVWAHDFAPAFNTARCDVDRRVVVSVPNEATPATLEYRLAAAVLLVDITARVACLRRISGVNFDERHPGAFGFVGQKRTELGERPRVQRGPLGLAKPYPVTGPRQFLDGDTASGAFSLGHDAFRNLMVYVGGEARLFTAAPLQQPPRRTGSLGLQAFPQPHLSFAIRVQSSTGRLLADARGGDVDNSHIDAKEPVGGHFQRGIRYVDGGMQKPLAVAKDQISFADRVRSQQRQLSRFANDR